MVLCNLVKIFTFLLHNVDSAFSVQTKTQTSEYSKCKISYF